VFKPAKTRTQGDGKSLQEFATAVKQVTHHTFPALHKDHVRRGGGKTSIDMIRDRYKTAVTSGDKWTLNKAMRQKGHSTRL
jgi:hypothetical protein